MGGSIISFMIGQAGVINGDVTRSIRRWMQQDRIIGPEIGGRGDDIDDNLIALGQILVQIFA